MGFVDMTDRAAAIEHADQVAPLPALTDVNPFSLVEAVNATSEIAHTGWLIFLGVVAYFCVAVAGVSHKDLLLNSAVQLPVLQVQIDLTRFFLFAPIVVVFMHFGLLVQHVMLARKVMEFDAAVRQMEPTPRRSHPIRHELHSYFFTQALAGPERSKLFGGFLHGMFWFSIVSFPVLVILAVQIVYLPYHDVATTWSHRLALVLDSIVLGLMGVFLGSRATTFLGAFSRTLRHQPLNFMSTLLLYVGVILFSFLVATVPGEGLDRLTQGLPGSVVKTAMAGDGRIETRRVFALTDLFFEGSGKSGAGMLSPFRRNLLVDDEDIVDRSKVRPGQITVSLRDRDLRYAELDRSNLEQSDLTGADLTGARLVGTNLRGAKLSCADVESVLNDPSLRARCTRLRAADLTRADLTSADVKLADASGASFQNAHMVETDLRYASLAGANLSGADLHGAFLGGGVELMGAEFLNSNLQGADLKGAKLQAADFYGADLQGARLVFAQALGANFQGARLSGANLSSAKLQGADLSDADLAGADFGASVIWDTKLPASGPTLDLADLSQIVIKPLETKDAAPMSELAKTIALPKVRAKVETAIDAVVNGVESTGWKGSEAEVGWAGLKQASASGDAAARRDQLTAALGVLACEADHADGAVAQGLIRRTVDSPAKINASGLLHRLRGPDCPALKRLPESLMLELEAAAEKNAPAQTAATAPAATDATMAAGGTAAAQTP